MLYLTRKIGQTVLINESISVTIVETRGKTVKLGFDFPPHVSVLRQELFEKIQSENRSAARAIESGILLQDDHNMVVEHNETNV